MFNIKGYSLYRRDRDKRRGGGIVIYLSDSFECEKCKVEVTETYEVLILKVDAKSSDNRYLVVAVYNPPNPKYNQAQFIDDLSASISLLLNQFPKHELIIAGDFNQLDVPILCASTGTVSLSSPPTRGKNILDRFLVTDADRFHIEIYPPISRSDHRLIMCYSQNSNFRPIKTKCKKRVYRPYPNIKQIDDMQQYLIALKTINHDEVGRDIDTIYSIVVQQWLSIIEYFVPMKTTKLKRGGIITSYIHCLLRRRNRQMRRGHMEHANALTEKIRKLMQRRKNNLILQSEGNAIKMWKAVNKFKSNFIENSDTDKVASIVKTADDLEKLNEFFASFSICTDVSYEVQQHHECKKLDDDNNIAFMSDEISAMLQSLKKTSTGCDNIPWWFLKHMAVHISKDITFLFNEIVRTRTSPTCWKKPIIIPIPKVTNVKKFSDLRPISVTCILARCFEKLIVKKFYKPIITSFKDQHAYKKTGSTTTALLDFSAKIANALERCDYVRCLLVDFSKAFDVVRPNLLKKKSAFRKLPVIIQEWAQDFLCKRSHSTKLGDELSSTININCSIVQGSVTGPFHYSMYADDLQPISSSNSIIKYADDSTLTVPQDSNVPIEQEYNNIKQWSKENKIPLNELKTKEIIIFRNSFAQEKYSGKILPILGIERVKTVRLLGVQWNELSNFDVHASSILEDCSKTMHIIRRLKAHGIKGDSLCVVCDALIMSKFRYALPVWSNFISKNMIHRIDKFLTYVFKMGGIKNEITFQQLSLTMDYKLFKSVKSNAEHALRHIMPSSRTTCHDLRQETYDLSCVYSKFCYNQFFNRMLR